MIPTLIDGELAFACGPVASGKTYLLKTWYESSKRAVFFDTPGEVFGLEGVHFGKDGPPSPKAFAQYIEQHEKEAYHCVYHPLYPEAGFEWVVDTMWQPLNPRLLIVDEVHHFMNPGYVHEKMYIINKYARKRLLSFVGSAQRIVDTHRDFTGACRLVVLFFTQEARDLDAVAERWGTPAAEQVANLRPLIYREATKTTEQTPQALLIRRGEQPEVFEVG